MFVSTRHELSGDACVHRKTDGSAGGPEGAGRAQSARPLI